MWPPGITGSITHTDELAAAATGTGVRSIGIDIERIAAVTPDLHGLIVTASEHAVPTALVFSAKESVHKCLHPITGVLLDFHDVELAFAGGTFHVVRARGVDASALRGAYTLGDGLVGTVAILG